MDECKREWSYKEDSNAEYGGVHTLRCTTCDEVIVSGSVGNGAGFRWLAYAAKEAWQEHVTRVRGCEMKLYREWVPILEIERRVKVMDPDGFRSVHRQGLHDTPMSKEDAGKFFAMSTVKCLAYEHPMRQIEMFVCWSNGRWNTHQISIPADTPEDRIEGVAWIAMEQQLQKQGVEAAFFGVYSIPEE